MLGEIHVPTREIAAVAERYHIRKLALFGSVLRDDFDSDSDIDMLVEFEPGHGGGFFNFITIQIELSELMGREVDLNTREDLSRYFRQKVLDGAVTIYERE
jgi:uncharacterized protein